MPPMAHHAATSSWLYPVPLALLTIAVAVLYLRGWRRRSSYEENAIPLWCRASFFLGLILIWLALGSPLASLDHRFLTAHMMQHLLLLTIAPALILLGDPIRCLSQGLPKQFVQGVGAQFFRAPSLRRVGRFLSNPIVCWLPATAVLVAWHIPSIFALAMQSHLLHLLEQATFLFAGFLFWWPVILPWPSVSIWSRWPILLYLFLATIPCDILSAYLTFCDSIVYPSYLTVPGASGLSVLRDQQLAGSLMWTCVTVIYLVPATVLTVQLLSRHGSAARSSAV
jgi:putative membrane protein